MPRHASLFCQSLARLAFFGFLLVGTLQAGPIPGVENISKTPVDFPHPPHLDVWDAGRGEYFVTFHWKPAQPVQHPHVVGDFNDWNKTDLPMTGPDADGVYAVTAKIAAGDREYKFFAAPDNWFQDPQNPERAPNGDNSLLRLGISALIRNMRPALGDGKMELRAVQHDPDQFLYFDAFGPEDVLVRVRALKNDVSAGSVSLVSQSGATTQLGMSPAGSDDLYDYFETHLRLGELPAANRPAQYTFVLGDGTSHTQLARTWPFEMDPTHLVTTPEWAKNAIWYQVLIDRFRDGDPLNNPEHTRGSSTQRSEYTHPWKSDFYAQQPWEQGKPFYDGEVVYKRLYGGDFKGLIERLDYIKSLGVTAIYCLPIFESRSTHKYDGRDYAFADDGYGVPGEFDRSMAQCDLHDPATWQHNASDKLAFKLIEETHKRGMKIIFDAVFNHLGNDSVSFLDVRQHLQQSRFRDWYEIKSWQPFDYVGWGGFGGLPQFKKDADRGLYDPNLIQHLYAITSKWMDPNADGDPSDGIDGWRLDVPNEIPAPFWRGWRKHVKGINPQAYITGEIWDSAEYWLRGDTFDAVMNYQFAEIAFRFFGNRQRKTTATQFDQELARLRIRYPRASTYVLQNLLDSHDTDRAVSRLLNPDLKFDDGNRLQDNGPNYNKSKPGEAEYQRLKLMAIFQATYVGAPMVWYGTEVGMYGADDPANRKPMWWEDLMPYDNPDDRIRPDLREHYRHLFALRNRHAALRTGDYRTLLAADDRDSFVFVRYASGDPGVVLVGMNNSATPQTLNFDLPGHDILPRGVNQIEPAFGGPAAKLAIISGKLELTLPPVGGAIFILKK